MLINFQIMAIIAAVFVASSTGIYFKGRWDGSSACDARHEAAQVKQTVKVRKLHAKVKHDAPGDSDKPAAIGWLFEHVRK
jgi:hypothetical protein